MFCCPIRETEVEVEGLEGNGVLLISALFSFIIATPTSPLLCMATHTHALCDTYVHTWAHSFSSGRADTFPPDTDAQTFLLPVN